MSNRGGVALALAGLAVAAILYCSPFLIDPSARVAGGAGDPIVIAYHVTWVAEHLGSRDVWNPPFFSPAQNVLAYSDHQFGQAVLAWPAVVAGLSPVAIVNLLQWLGFFLTSVAVFWWLLDSRGDVLPSAAAAITVTYCAWRVAQLSHPQLLFMPFLPLALLCYGRAIERRGGEWLLWMAAALLACQALFTPSLTVFMMPLVAVWIATAMLAAGRREPPVDSRRSLSALRRWLQLPASLVAVGVVLLPIAAHYWELGPAFERSPVEVARFSVGWRDWLSAPESHWLYGDLLALTRGSERELFPGIAFLGLLVIGIATGRRQWPALVTAAVAIWASTGPSPGGGITLWHLPYDLIVAVVPGGRFVRVPARFYPLLAIVVAPIIAEGWKPIVEGIMRRVEPARLAVAVTILLVALTLAEGVPGRAVHEPAPDLSEGAIPAELASGGVLFLPLGDDRAEIQRMWQARRSGVPVVNGYSGHPSPLWESLRHLQTSATDAETRRAIYTRLLHAGVDTILVDAPTPAIVDPGLLRPLSDRIYRIPAATPQPVLHRIALGQGVGLLVPEDGWSYPEGSDTESWVWSLNRRTTVLVPMDGSPLGQISLRVRGLTDVPSPIELVWNGRPLGVGELVGRPTTVSFPLPEAATRTGWTRFEIRGPEPGPAPPPDSRRLSLSLYEISVK